ncbi:hypothetical protein L873DRAFT_1808856 [Choiromyces venosus 120613-1]|uniref:Uncharacterized protein n=1 Tax=Choiromyces venosus 120613-1 TaxID=1336337 RepID=A0A3N4JLY9_9PEZI|nr:hypothetical protein L873DRAFT_1808856 [Choiromyces venosus 120613-1]
MQFKILAIAALVAGASATNKTHTNGTVPTTTGGVGGSIGGGSNGTLPTGSPSGAPEPNGAFVNAVSGGVFGAVVAAGLTLVL